MPTLRASASDRTELLLQDSTATTQRREARTNRGRVDANTSQATNQPAEQTAQSEISTDSLARKAKAALNMPITGRATDSLHYDLRTKRVYLYEKGEVTYDKFNLKADFMDIDLNTNNVLAYGRPDSVDGKKIMTRTASIAEEQNKAYVATKHLQWQRKIAAQKAEE